MLKIDRRLVEHFDWVLLGAVLILALTGIMTIFSATRPLPGAEHPSYYIRQSYWLLIGMAAMVVTASFDYAWLRKAAPYLYTAGIGLLVFTLLKGTSGMGARRWINVGPIGFQPSEVFKLVFMVMLALHLSRLSGSLNASRILATLGAFVIVPFVLVVKQPDLGTAVVILCIFLSLALAKGVKRNVVALSVIIALISVPFVGSIVWDELKDYQKKRILVFIQPDSEPGGVSYHINQSKVAVGSGGVLGKGYLKGTQGPFRFLPEKHTDFIFSVFAEERGFVGSLLLLLVYMVLILRGLSTSQKAKDEFGRLLAMGITFMFTMYCFVNVGMTLGLMPVVGIPLPFMSYGGTALVSNFIAVGLLINVRAHRFELFN